ncbi:MAG TPA: cbb3-type cytochrome c oxidase subunit 3 [Candidatus Cybelea sp.]|nr:cbb3-type cytochrome c oxidase subunit 3 [Candidatus Cybelea sp.]
MSWIDVAILARQVWVAWLMLVFLGITFYAFRPKNREHFKNCADIPFTTDSDEPRKSGAQRK